MSFTRFFTRATRLTIWTNQMALLDGARRPPAIWLVRRLEQIARWPEMALSLGHLILTIAKDVTRLIVDKLSKVKVVYIFCQIVY